MEHLDEFFEDTEAAPYQDALCEAGLLVNVLADLRSKGRLWAIAHTKAEELSAWLSYAYDTDFAGTEVTMECER